MAGWAQGLRRRWHRGGPIHLSETPGGVRLSDKGDTLTRISYDHDIDAFLAGSRGLLIERILGEKRVRQDRGVFYVDAPTDGLSDALFRYGRALTRIYDLTLHSRSRAVSTFLRRSRGPPRSYVNWPSAASDAPLPPLHPTRP